MTPSIKAEVVERLQQLHHKYVWAFGDSVVDLEMLKRADQAVVVVGEEQNRSKSMEKELRKAIEEGLFVRQLLVPRKSTTVPLYDVDKTPLIRLDDQEHIAKFITSPFHRFTVNNALDDSPETAKVLTTPTRDKKVAALELRKAHHRVGHYLAVQYLTKIIDLETFEMMHVTGKPTKGHRLLHEIKATMIPLMRGGEPMAFGVSEAFPLAMFVHAKEPEHVKAKHLEGRSTVILVDNVINEGNTIVEFVRHVRKNHRTILIVIVAGVVQQECIGKGGLLPRELNMSGKIDLVTLRTSEEKYTGTGGTDTGARLFNTTGIE